MILKAGAGQRFGECWVNATNMSIRLVSRDNHKVLLLEFVSVVVGPTTAVDTVIPLVNKCLDMGNAETNNCPV